MIYLVSLVAPSAEAWRCIEENWPARHYIISDTMSFVAVQGITTAGQVGKKIGLTDDGEHSASGLVVKIAAAQSWGMLPSDAVDWLRQAEASELQ